MADLQELFSRLKSPTASAPDNANPQPQPQHQLQHQQHQQPPPPQPSIWAQPQPQPAYQQPSVSSPIFSPPMHTPNPHHPSAIMSPNVGSLAGTPAPDSKANNLLNLLKFNTGQQAAQQSPLASLQNIGSSGRSSSMNHPSLPQAPHQTRVVSASDLVASFQPKPQGASSLRVSMPAGDATVRTEGLTSPPGDTQNFLLNLLNRPKQFQADASLPMQSPAPQAPPADVENLVKGLGDASLEPSLAQQVAREPTPVRLFGTTESRDATPFEAPSSAKKGPVFTYVNPFEQLSASSPQPKAGARSATPKVEILKHQRDVSTSVDGDAGAPHSKSRKLASAVASPTPSPMPAQRSGRGLDTRPDGESQQQSVSEALSGIGEKVDKQVEKALAQAASASASAPALNAAAAQSQEQDGDKSKPTEEVADSWESADAEESPAKGGAAHVVQVYNFPMKPFVSIELQKAKQAVPLRSGPDALMDIARLKKDFEQIDRTLVTASATHIVYAMSKDGGFRIIRQDSGKDKKVFKSSQERIFNVQICTATGAHKDTEAILATGINGSVYWTTIAKVEGDAFDEYNLESQGFILPPVPVQDDNTSGSPVKTRAKMSSRHAEFFAISRGKSIYIISPYVARHNTYTDKKSRIVDNEKYLQERCLKIHTGKAGKDFAFSEDDSLLVSLDKSGRIKFWDIREMAELAQDTGVGKRSPVEQKAPLLTLTTTLPMEKATPSSIMFVDKERPCVKGVALRYLIVGLKQNHILQLWDLGLNKPVQELHFPHEKDSDAICSIAYHPKTGIIALGHPTRNSIYFIHLSAPRYNIQSMDQARYITMLASQDPSLARPESTAIMSGCRELSFASKGQLRSVDMLKTPVVSEAAENVLFELYAMHSKGVTCINIKHEDLGWSPDNKVLHPADAEESGYIIVNDIRASTAPPSTETSSDAPAKPSGSTQAPAAVAQKLETPKSSRSSSKQGPSSVNGSAKGEKLKKVVAEAAAPPEPTNPAILTPASYAMAAQRSKSPQSGRASPVRAIASAAKENASAPSNGSASINMESINQSISEAFSKELDVLYRRVDDDRRVQDAAAAAKQDAVLRLVSSTLTDNVEKSLSRIVSSSIHSTVLPAVSDVSAAVVDRRLTEVLTTQISSALPKEIKSALPSAIALALRDKDVLRTISEQTATKLSAQVDQSFTSVLRNSIVPSFTKLAMSTTQSAIADVQRHFGEQLRQAEVQRVSDHAKIEQLTNLVLGLSKTVHEMAAGQSAFQEQILKFQRPGLGSAHESSSRSVETAEADIVQSIEDQELAVITDKMTQGNYEEGTILWLQSPRQGELFDKLFVRINPQYLQRLSPLVALSVSAALTSSFDQNINERLEWLGSVLSHIDLKDPEIREVVPKIMDVLQQRMQGAYMQIAEVNVQDPALRKVSVLSRQISEIKSFTE
ncbi:hypothetical protein MBLNU459_g8343t3 [Dothideomycetes sp. NU459]